MKHVILTMTIVCCATWAAAQGGGLSNGKYKYIELRRVGTMTGNYQSGHFLRAMKGGVDMTFVADVPEDNLLIRAQTADFSYADGETGSPSKIHLVGKVYIENMGNTIRSGAADIDFDSGEAVFVDNPEMDTKQAQGLRASRIRINLETGDYEMTSVRIRKLDLSAGKPVASAQDLKTEDIRDWEGFLAMLKKQTLAPGASPGKHIVSLLDETVRGAVATMDVAALAQNQSLILKQLNRALLSPQFYNANAWRGVPLNRELNDLISSGRAKSDSSVLLRFHRLLLQAAYPRYIAPPPAR